MDIEINIGKKVIIYIIEEATTNIVEATEVEAISITIIILRDIILVKVTVEKNLHEELKEKQAGNTTEIEKIAMTVAVRGDIIESIIITIIIEVVITLEGQIGELLIAILVIVGIQADTEAVLILLKSIKEMMIVA